MRIGWTELIIILIIAFVIFGGGKLAGVGGAIGKTIKEFKQEIKNDDEDAVYETDKTQAENSKTE